VLSIYKSFGSRQGISETYMNMGHLALRWEKYRDARHYYTESIRLAEVIPNQYVLSWSHWGRGHASYKSGNFAEALPDLDRSEKYAQKVESNEVLVSNYNTRRELLNAQHKYKEALAYSVLASQLSDSLRKTDVAKRFINLEKIQEIEQRNRDIRMLQQEKFLAENKIQLQGDRLRQQSLLIIGGLIGLLIAGALAFIYYRFYSRIKLLNTLITGKNTRIQAQADKLREVNEELNRLYHEVSQQKEEILVQTDKLAESNKGISEMNRGLEKVVSEKTLELRKINAELVKKNNELLQFSFTVSHNLRGPVARLLGLSDLAVREEMSDDTKQLIQFIGLTATELDQIIKDLVNILELRNNPKHHREAVSLQEEWRQTTTLLKDSLMGNEELSADFAALPHIVTVRSMLHNILYNLLSNAIKFRSPERVLKVSASSRIENGNAVLEIRDNGLGFNIALHQEKIFKLYRRFHAHVGGRGIGLYLIKTQVEVLHGKVEATSEPNKGAMFRVILPLNGDQ
jgi:signal transduction histidine kinase